MDPASLKYAATHEWVYLENEIATVGISDFAVKQLSDLVYIELPPVGRTIAVGETFGEVESVKAVSDLYAPVSGEVIEVNGALADHLETLGDDPYTKGWMIKVRTDDTSVINALMDYDAYQLHCQSEGH